MPRYGKTARSVRQMFLFQTAELFLSEIVFPAPRILFVMKFITQLFFPGFVDVHVHLREPGFSYKETIRTGTLAAAHGGFAHVAAMPNLNPVPDCKASLEEELRRIRESACVHVHPYGAISVGQKGEQLADLDAMVPEVIAFSDDGKGVQSESLMREAMEQCRRLGKILAAHCEDNRLLRGGYIHDGAYAKTHSHRGICSESEWGPDCARCAPGRGDRLCISCVSRLHEGKRFDHPGGKTARRKCNMRDRAALSDLYGG